MNQENLMDCIEIIKGAIGRPNKTNCIESFSSVQDKVLANMYDVVSLNPVVLIEKYSTYNRLFYFLTGNENAEVFENLQKKLDVYEHIYADFTTKSVLLNEDSFFEKASFSPYRIYARKNVKKTDKRYKELLPVSLAKNEDSNVINDLLCSTFDMMSDHIPQLDELRDLLKKNEVLKVEIQGNLAGVLLFHDCGVQSYARCLCVVPEFQNGFIGYSLLAKYFNSHLESDAKNFYLWVDEKNDAVRKLHDSFGYRADGLKNYVFKRG